MAANRFDQLIDHWEPILRKAFLEAVQNIRDGARLGQIERMIEAGDVEGAIREVGLNPASFRPYDRALQAAYEAGGVATAKLAPASVHFHFNVRNIQAEEWLRRYSGNLIQEIYDDQRQMIRDTIQAGLSRGANPRETALDLVGRIGANGRRQGGLIGLTTSQAQWVGRYYSELIDDPKATLKRSLRDKRFDKTILAYDKRGEPLPEELMRKMFLAYRNRALRYRAETIARKETITALHAAQEHAIDQMVAAGNITQQSVRFIWRTAHDKRVRDTHKPMDGQVRPYGRPFETGAGVHLDYPGDPNGPAAEVINCRCWREPWIDHLAGIR